MKRANLIVSNLYQLSPGVKLAIVHDWDMDEQVSDCTRRGRCTLAVARKMKRGIAVVVDCRNGEVFDVVGRSQG